MFNFPNHFILLRILPVMVMWIIEITVITK